MKRSAKPFSSSSTLKGFLSSAVMVSGMSVGLSLSVAEAQVAERQLGPTQSATTLQTRKQRLAVEPVNWDEARGKVIETGTAAERQSIGDPGTTAGEAPEPGANKNAQSEFPEEWKILDQGEGDTIKEDKKQDNVQLGTKDVFTQYCENCSGLNLNFPQRAIGKLFMNTGSCSASVISSKNGGVIVTAGHCVYDRSKKKFITRATFIPAYRDGAAPYGQFPAVHMRWLTGWVNTGQRRYDVAVLRLGKNSKGKNVTSYTGSLGKSWNYGDKQVHHAVGYPGNIGGGNKQELCVSESNQQGTGCAGNRVLRMGCSMTYGASGGPWIRGYRNGNWVNSVVSGYDSSACTGGFGKTFNGGRFTSSNIAVLCSGGYC
jgi:V8-like Glu-specific endopeptidase